MVVIGLCLGMTTSSLAAGGDPPDTAKPATAEPAKTDVAEPDKKAEPAKAAPAKAEPAKAAAPEPAKKAEPEKKPEPKEAEPAKKASDEVDVTKWHLTPRLTLFLAHAPLVGAVVPGITLRKAIKAESPLTNNTYMSFGVDFPANPTLVAIRPNMEFSPLAILRITMAYWGIFQTGVDMSGGHSLSVADRDSDTTKATWEARAGEGQARIQHRFTFNVRLQAAVANLLAVVVETEADAWYVEKKAGDGKFMFHSLYDNLIRLGRVDGGIMNRSLLLFYAWRSQAKASLLVGVVNEYVKMFASQRERDRLGLAVVFNAGEEIDEIERMQVTLMGGVNMLDTNYQYDPWFQIVIRMYWDVEI